MLIIDNGCQFAGAKFVEFCEDLSIFHHFTSVAHLQANDEAEVINKTLLQGIKIRLKWAKGAWMDELYYVLWLIEPSKGFQLRKYLLLWLLELRQFSQLNLDSPQHGRKAKMSREIHKIFR